LKKVLKHYKIGQLGTTIHRYH